MNLALFQKWYDPEERGVAVPYFGPLSFNLSGLWPLKMKSWESDLKRPDRITPSSISLEIKKIF